MVVLENVRTISALRVIAHHLTANNILAYIVQAFNYLESFNSHNISLITVSISIDSSSTLKITLKNPFRRSDFSLLPSDSLIDIVVMTVFQSVF